MLSALCFKVAILSIFRRLNISSKFTSFISSQFEALGKKAISTFMREKKWRFHPLMVENVEFCFIQGVFVDHDMRTKSSSIIFFFSRCSTLPLPLLLLTNQQLQHAHLMLPDIPASAANKTLAIFCFAKSRKINKLWTWLLFWLLWYVT